MSTQNSKESLGTDRSNSGRSIRSGATSRESMPLLGYKSKDKNSRAGSGAYTRWWVIICLLMTEAFERWCFYTIAGTIAQISTIKFDMEPAQANTLANGFSMIVYLVPLFMGGIADNFLGNMWTTGLCCCAYTGGMALVALSSANSIDSQTMFFIGIYLLVSVGTGLKSTLMNLAADQLVQEPGQSDADFASTRQVFFNSWYGSIQVGGLIANMLMTTIATQGLGAISQDKGFFWAYLIAGFAFVGGFLAFLLAIPGMRSSSMQGRICAKKQPGAQKSQSPFAKIMSSIWYEGKKGFTGKGDYRGAVGFVSWIIFVIAVVWTFINSVIEKNSATKIFSYIDLALFIVFFILNIWAYRRAENWVSDPDIGVFMQLTTVQFAPIAFMFTAYSSMSTGFVQSGCQWNVRLFGGEYQFNAAFLSGLDSISVLIWTLVLNFAIEPFFRRRKIHFGVKRRFIVGSIGFMMSMAAAAGLEVWRRDYSNKGDLVNQGHLIQPWDEQCPTDPNNPKFWGCQNSTAAYSKCAFVQHCNSKPNDELLAAYPFIKDLKTKDGTPLTDTLLYDTCAPMTDLSGWIMAIPFFLTGLGETFVSAGAFDYTYSKCPPMLRSTSIGIVLISLGTTASGMSAAINTMTEGMINKHFGDLNYNHLEYIFLIVMGFAGMGIISTLVVDPVRVFVVDDDNVASDRAMLDRDLSFGECVIRTAHTQESLVIAHVESDKKVRQRGLGEKEVSYQKFEASIGQAAPLEGGTPSQSQLGSRPGSPGSKISSKASSPSKQK